MIHSQLNQEIVKYTYLPRSRTNMLLLVLQRVKTQVRCWRRRWWRGTPSWPHSWVPAGPTTTRATRLHAISSPQLSEKNWKIKTLFNPTKKVPIFLQQNSMHQHCNVSQHSKSVDPTFLFLSIYSVFWFWLCFCYKDAIFKTLEDRSSKI